MRYLEHLLTATHSSSTAKFSSAMMFSPPIRFTPLKNKIRGKFLQLSLYGIAISSFLQIQFQKKNVNIHGNTKHKYFFRWKQLPGSIEIGNRKKAFKLEYDKNRNML